MHLVADHVPGEELQKAVIFDFSKAGIGGPGYSGEAENVFQLIGHEGSDLFLTCFDLPLQIVLI